MINERQKITTKLYRLMWSLTFDESLTPDEVQELKQKVNKLRGFEFYKGLDDEAR